jgi:hypothetical protein
MTPIAMFEKPSRCARSGVSVEMRPFPASRNAVETNIAAIDMI